MKQARESNHRFSSPVPGVWTQNLTGYCADEIVDGEDVSRIFVKSGGDASPILDPAEEGRLANRILVRLAKPAEQIAYLAINDARPALSGVRSRLQDAHPAAFSIKQVCPRMALEPNGQPPTLLACTACRKQDTDQ